MSKTFICTCEDVTREDLIAAIEAGYHDLESVKRYTGIGTGFCQGKVCLTNAAAILDRYLTEHGRHLTGPMPPTTARPPLHPIPLKILAAAQPEIPIYPPAEAPGGVPPIPPFDDQTLAPLPKKAAVVIIGGGIIGLSLAYNMARLGQKDILLLERSYINSGASGRCGGGIREQWSTEQNVLLMRESIQILRAFAHQMHINIWFRQGGYLFLTDNEAQQEVLEKNAELQNRLGVPTRLMAPEKAAKIVPGLKTDGMRLASYNPEDGILFPWPVLWGYVTAARNAGVTVADFTSVTGLTIHNSTITEVVTNRGTVACDLVINAAGAWAPQIGALANVKLPNKPERHEIMVLEPLKPFVDPMVSVLSSGLYFSQSMRGEIVGGMGDPDEPPGVEMRSSYRFMNRMARALVGIMPVLSEVKLMRQWAGCYDKTADGNPIVGHIEGMTNFFQLHGFMGHGFMMAPVVGKIVAEHLVRGTGHPFIANNNLSRFYRGELKKEVMIIG